MNNFRQKTNTIVNVNQIQLEIPTEMLVPVGSDNVTKTVCRKYQVPGQDINTNTVANEKYKYYHKST